MAISRDLFLSILSMDAYNRGYGVGVSGLSATIGTRIGNATILRNANDREGVAIAAGFYAIAYDVSDAGIDGLSGTVISYRGSDYQDTNGISPFSRRHRVH